MSEPDEAVLHWAAASTGGTVDSVENLHTYQHRGSGTYLVRTSAGEFVLKIPVPNWIGERMVATNARALELAASYGIAAPQLIAADLTGETSGTVATLETMLTGSSAVPPTQSAARLKRAGAAIAKVHAYALTPQDQLPYRPRPVAVDDFANERRQGRMPTTPLLDRADKQTRDHGVPPGDTMFVHGDVHPGNMLWTDDTCTALIDWKTAGVGDPGVDLCGLRLELALFYGPVAADHVLQGWEREAGRSASAVPYWDAIAALNTPTVLQGWSGFASDGSTLDALAITERRDAFLQAALDQL